MWCLTKRATDLTKMPDIDGVYPAGELVYGLPSAEQEFDELYVGTQHHHGRMCGWIALWQLKCLDIRYARANS